jgi:hypothetical protein
VIEQARKMRKAGIDTGTVAGQGNEKSPKDSYADQQ